MSHKPIHSGFIFPFGTDRKYFYFQDITRALIEFNQKQKDLSIPITMIDYILQ